MNQTNSNNIHISSVLLMFLFLFAPPLIPKINFIIFMGIIAAFYLFTEYKKEVSTLVGNQKFKNLVILIFVSYIYIATIMLLGLFFDPVNAANYLKTIYRIFLVFPVTIIISLFLLFNFKEKKYNKIQILKVIISAGLIQLIFTVSMVVFSPLRDLLLMIIHFNTGNELSQNLWHLQRRFFAFSQNVFDTFGYGTGIIAALSLFYALYTNKYKLIILFPLLLLVPLFNARTGIIIGMLGLFYIFLYLMIDGKVIKMIKISVLALILSISIIPVYSYLSEKSPETIMWVESGYLDIISVIKGEEGSDSATVILSDEKWELPDDLRLVFGSGHTVFEADGYRHSDIGYVNDIWLVGIVGFIIFYSFFALLLVYAIQRSISKLDTILILYLTSAFLMTNIKTIVYSYNVGTALILFLLIYFAFENRIYEKNNENEVLK